MTNEELNTELYRKMSDEFEKYKEELLGLPSEEILEHAYAYTVKQDILFAMEDHDLSDKQAAVLLKSEHPLEDVFSRWENHEGHYMDEIRDIIDCTANEKLRDEFLKSQREAR